MPVDQHVSRRLADGGRWELHAFDEIDSTNVWLRDHAADLHEGAVAVADHQTAGRGRLGRTWEAPAGSALLVSVLLRPQGLAPERLHLTTVAVALAAADACTELAGVTPQLKWPNDLLDAGDRKLAGVLAEAVGDAVVVGIGLNLTDAPEGAARLGDVGRDAVLEELLRRLGDRLDEGWDAVAAAYRERCATVGRRVRVELADRTVEGLAAGIDEGGRLVVDHGASAPLVVSAGDVVHLRPAT